MNASTLSATLNTLRSLPSVHYPIVAGDPLPSSLQTKPIVYLACLSSTFEEAVSCSLRFVHTSITLGQDFQFYLPFWVEDDDLNDYSTERMTVRNEQNLQVLHRSSFVIVWFCCGTEVLITPKEVVAFSQLPKFCEENGKTLLVGGKSSPQATSRVPLTALWPNPGAQRWHNSTEEVLRRLFVSL